MVPNVLKITVASFSKLGLLDPWRWRHNSHSKHHITTNL